MLYKRILRNTGAVLAGYLILTLVTSIVMRDLSLRHTVFFLVDSMLFVGGAHLYADRRRYYIDLSALLLVFCSVFMIRWLTPTYIQLWEIANYFSFSFALSNLVLIAAALFKRRWLSCSVTAILLGGTFLPIVILWGYYFSEYSWLNVEGVMAILQTNPSEAWSYVHDRTGFGGYLACLLYVGFVMAGAWQAKGLMLKPGKTAAWIGVLFFVVLNIVLLRRTSDNFVMSIYEESKAYTAHYTEFKKAKEQRAQGLSTALNVEKTDEKGIYVLVIGESQNRKHMSAYGYDKDTTPWLSSMKDDSRLLLFDHAYSCHVQTVPVLSYALTAKNQYNDMELEQAVSIVDMARAAGYETVWLSNQVRYSAWDTPISVIAETADYHEWINSHVGETLDTDYYDGELLERLKNVPKSDKMLIVLHLMGNHISYQSRYPETFNQFHGDGKISEYDNSMLYNDYVMKQLLSQVTAMPNFKGLVYFADHSEAVDENMSHNPGTFVFDMADIPFYMYFSDAYIQEHGDRFEQLSKERQSCFTDDLIFNALMGIMGIHEPQLYEPQNDLTSKSYDSELNRFVTLYGKRHISEDQ